MAGISLEEVSISVIFPCYNDSGTIGELVMQSDELLRNLKLSHEIIVVDDCSTDSSYSTLANIKGRIPSLKIIRHSTNKGYGGALRSGFSNAAGYLIFYTDGDGQYDISELPILLAAMTDDTDFVNGIKIQRSDPWYREAIGIGYNRLVRFIFGLTLFDTDCDYRLIRKRVLESIVLTCDSGAICVELAKKIQSAGANIRQVSVHHYPRRYGRSQFFRPMNLVKTFMELGALWMRIVLWK